MVRFVDWLAERRGINVLIVVAYSALILHMHDPMVEVSVALMKYFTRQLYDVIVGVVACTFLIGIVYYFIKKLLQYRHATELKIGYLLTIVSLLFLHTQINFVMNIELIHTVEFGILAVLIFPFTRRFGDTAFYALLVGILDEWYQYKILYTDRLDNNYFDFNDMVLDLLGIGLALTLIYAAGLNNKTYPPKVKWYRSPVFYITAVMAGTITVLFKLSLIHQYGENSEAWFILSKVGPQGFWNHLPNSDIVYHVMQPLEGTVILLVLLSLFFGLDYFARKAVTAASGHSRNERRFVSPVL